MSLQHNIDTRNKFDFVVTALKWTYEFLTIPLFFKDVKGFITAKISPVVSGWLERHRMNESRMAG